jgi:hypothetical protein
VIQNARLPIIPTTFGGVQSPGAAGVGHWPAYSMAHRASLELFFWAYYGGGRGLQIKIRVVQKKRDGSVGS